MFKQALAKAQRGKDNKDDSIRLWQICRPISKLYYTVIFILYIPQRYYVFKQASNNDEATSLIPRRDNLTRWNLNY